MELRVRQLRGGQVESEHPIAAALVDAEGRVLERVGEPMVTTWRSAAKPFQLEISASFLPDSLRSELAPEDLAIGAASHHGEPAHTERVRSLLARFGCEVDHLYCGAHWPNEATTHAMLRRGEQPTAVHNNCSGKHTFMAAACRFQGWAADYRDRAHPLQAAIVDNIQARSGGALVDAVIDGCGVPCFVLPLDGMARAWANLAVEAFRGDTEPLGRIGRAMNAHPWQVSGTGAVDGELMRQAARPIVAKVGAEGLICVALVEEGLGLAVKATTGSAAARAIGLHAVLDRFFPGLVPDEAKAPWRRLRNWVGTEVGEIVPSWA